MTLRALDQAAVIVLERLLDDLKAQRLSVANLRTVDEERFALRLECVAPDELPADAAQPGLACPACGSGEFTDAGDEQLCCLACSHNWSPGSARTEG